MAVTVQVVPDFSLFRKAEQHAVADVIRAHADLPDETVWTLASALLDKFTILPFQS